MVKLLIFFPTNLKANVFIIFSLVFLCFSSFYAQIDKLKYNEVKFYELEQTYQNMFVEYKDSSFMKNPQTYLTNGYILISKGYDEPGNYLMNFALDHYIEKNADLFHMLSVQNTKNGNYDIATSYLDSAAKYSKETYGYYGWVMLYYYHDYKRALQYLTIYDSLTPNFSDFPMGESIHYLKGLAFMQLEKFQEAIQCFDLYIDEEKKVAGKKWIDGSCFYYKGICLEKRNNFKSAMKCYKSAIQYNKKFLEAIFRKSLLTNKKSKKLSDLKLVRELIHNGYSKTDVYVQIFHPVYIQEVELEISKLK